MCNSAACASARMTPPRRIAASSLATCTACVLALSFSRLDSASSILVISCLASASFLSARLRFFTLSMFASCRSVLASIRASRPAMRSNKSPRSSSNPREYARLLAKGSCAASSLASFACIMATLATSSPICPCASEFSTRRASMCACTLARSLPVLAMSFCTNASTMSRAPGGSASRRDAGSIDGGGAAAAAGALVGGVGSVPEPSAKVVLLCVPIWLPPPLPLLLRALPVSPPLPWPRPAAAFAADLSAARLAWRIAASTLSNATWSLEM
mmetsp:Transcript_29267/g.88573  ORF Transcript_29267/g.88573 Transcript_29267/m.88573 type:complete len:272 (-) Transcript_29267:252-1067(-)